LRILRYRNNCNRYGTRPETASVGFTMVEVVVALAILATTVVAMFGAMRNCLTAAHHSRMLTGSVLLAETLLAEAILSEKMTFETKRGQQDSYRWQVQTVATPIENLGAIRVKVSWWEQQREQQYELLCLVQIKTTVEGK